MDEAGVAVYAAEAARAAIAKARDVARAVSDQLEADRIGAREGCANFCAFAAGLRRFCGENRGFESRIRRLRACSTVDGARR